MDSVKDQDDSANWGNESRYGLELYGVSNTIRMDSGGCAKKVRVESTIKAREVRNRRRHRVLPV
jgi:hypothetical protein